MSGLYSRNKGKRAERELRDIFIEHGWAARRGQQFKGGSDSPDVVVPDLDEFYLVESKFVEKLDMHSALAKATEDAGDKVPLLFHKRSNKGWIVILTVEDLFEILTKLHDKKQNEQHNPCHTDGEKVSGKTVGECEVSHCTCKG